MEVIRFGCVGVAATLTHFTLLYLSIERLSMDPTIANGLAFSISVLVTFFGQSLWVFRGHGGISRVRIAKFGISLFAGLLGNVAIMAFCTRVIHLHYSVGFISALLLVPAGSYIMNKFWVFRRPSI